MPPRKKAAPATQPTPVPLDQLATTISDATLGAAELEGLFRLSNDIKLGAKLLGQRRARWLVDIFYSIQDFRIQANNQVRAAAEEPEPHKLLAWVARNMTTFENDILRSLNVFAREYTIGRWLQSICGIGPVLSAGLLAHLDITKAHTASNFWSFAGLDPDRVWRKGEVRPWNAKLRVLVWKIGRSFMMVQSSDKDFYGALYVERKAMEITNNEAGKYASQARHIIQGDCWHCEGLEAPNPECPLCLGKGKVTPRRIGKDTDAYAAYSQGMLPKAHVDARARRWVAKLFLSHLFRVMHEERYGNPGPLPYSMEHPAGTTHRHLILPPNWPFADRAKPLSDMPIDPDVRADKTASSK